MRNVEKRNSTTDLTRKVWPKHTDYKCDICINNIPLLKKGRNKSRKSNTGRPTEGKWARKESVELENRTPQDNNNTYRYRHT